MQIPSPPHPRHHPRHSLSPPLSLPPPFLIFSETETNVLLKWKALQQKKAFQGLNVTWLLFFFGCHKHAHRRPLQIERHMLELQFSHTGTCLNHLSLHCILGLTACKKFSTPCCTPVVWKLVWPRLARGTLQWQWVLRGAAALVPKSRERRTAPPALTTPLQLEGFSPGSHLCSSVPRPVCTKSTKKQNGRMIEKSFPF